MSNKLIIMQEHIENRIFTLRGVQVMIDFHLAELYQVETRALNQAVKRNAERFPKDFMFQLTKEEWLSVQSQIVLIERQNLKSQIVTSSEHGGRRKLPFVFTEQGVASLSGVLKSETATNVFIAIMRAFISMRKLLLNNASIFQRLDIIELKQIETNKKFEQVFKALERNKGIPFAKSHDRFLIIDGTEVYHLGASLKDLGKKLFAFSKLNKASVDNIMKLILELI
jgi:hypothetical protein